MGCIDWNMPTLPGNRYLSDKHSLVSKPFAAEILLPMRTRALGEGQSWGNQYDFSCSGSRL